MGTPVNWEELGVEAGRDRRRENRVSLAFPIEVTGFDETGKFFCERTQTLDVSESGCAFLLSRKTDRGGVLAIRVVSRLLDGEAQRKPLLYQVARASRDKEGWIVGAAKLQLESLWCIAFPKDNKNAPVA